MFVATTALKKVRAAMKSRILILEGGTSASKTVSVLLILIDMAQRDTSPTTTDVVSESLPHIKMGALKDFTTIMRTQGYWDESSWAATDKTYTFPSGSMMRFYGVDDQGKVTGPRRDRLFINEANNVTKSVFDQMEIRTTELIIIDHNPVSEYWAHTEVMPHMEHDFVRLTYLDNEALDPRVKASIESRKHNVSWWRVYGLGMVGTKEGQVYDNWRQIDTVPEEAVRVRRWLDFGFTNDPTAIGSLFTWGHNDKGLPRVVVDEEEYRTGMNNGQIGEKILGLPDSQTLVVADSQEPKSIEEIKHRGLRNIIGSVKGVGSVNFGIDTVKGFEVYYTKRSTNIAKEQRNYLWKIDRDGKPLNVPEDLFNHHLDGIRYVISDLVGNPVRDSLKSLISV